MIKQVDNLVIQKSQERPVLVIAGPTASGKTETAMILGERLGGEIVSADSMQIYQGMDIGTAKASLAERQRLPHHLLDIRQPGDRFSVADYKVAATAAINDIYARGKWPILCGGTGQYLGAMIAGLEFTAVPTDYALRESLNQEAANLGLNVLYQRLQQVDPETAARLAPADQKRIVRALEIFLQTSRTIGEFNRDSRRVGPDFQYQAYCLCPDRSILYERINQRVQKMVESGLAGEVQQCLDLNLPAASTCLQAIGYKEMLPYLHDEVSLADTVACIQQATRRYAKRQLTWFRKMPELKWLMNQNIDQNVKIILEDLSIFGYIRL